MGNDSRKSCIGAGNHHNKMMLDEKQFKSVGMLLLLIVWIYFLKICIQLPILLNNIYYDAQNFAEIVAKRMIFCGWGFLILFTLTNKGDWPTFSGGILSFLPFAPAVVSIMFILLASIYGLIVEEDNI